MSYIFFLTATDNDTLCLKRFTCPVNMTSLTPSALLWSWATFAAWCSIFSCLIVATSRFHASVMEMRHHLFALASAAECVPVPCEMSNRVPLTCFPVRPSTRRNRREAMHVLAQQWRPLGDKKKSSNAIRTSVLTDAIQRDPTPHSIRGCWTFPLNCSSSFRPTWTTMISERLLLLQDSFVTCCYQSTCAGVV